MNIQIQAALNSLNKEGDLTHGTRQLVESIKEVEAISYAEIANIAQCSVPGITRWRNNDSGKSSRLIPLIRYAESLAGQSIMSENSPSLNNLSISEAVKSLKIKDIEEKITDTLEELLGDSLEECTLYKISTVNNSVKLELLLE